MATTPISPARAWCSSRQGSTRRAAAPPIANDPEGRLKLLDTNAGVYRDMVPRIVEAAPEAVLLVVTDPPDPLADLARRLAGHDRVLSTGTLLDSLRFRVHLAERLGVSAASVEALVVGEHGTSEVLLWSSARVGGVPIAGALPAGMSIDEFRKGVEHDVRYANIAIIEGNDASQFGIGIVSVRIAEAVLRDERAVFPIGAFNAEYGVTLSLPSVVGRQGVSRILEPAMSRRGTASPARERRGSPQGGAAGSADRFDCDRLRAAVSLLYLGIGIAVWVAVQAWEWYEERGRYEIQAIRRARRGTTRQDAALSATSPSQRH